MKKSAITNMPVYFDRYIHVCTDVPVMEMLAINESFAPAADLKNLEQLGEKIYAPGKWSVKTIIQHITDTERIMAYRALRFSRKDLAVLPGFDQDHFAMNAYADERTLQDLLLEFRTVRQSTLLLFKSFSDTMLLQEGTCMEKKISVLALGFVIAGHQLHHLNIIRERYYPLL